METAYCSSCIHFRDKDGRCRRLGKSVGYFAKPCNQYTTIENEKIMETKHCNKCGRDLPLDAFGKKTGTKDGLQSWCKECQKQSTLAARERKKGNPTPAKEDADRIPTAVEFYTDEQIIAELKRRGWAGSIYKKIEYNL